MQAGAHEADLEHCCVRLTLDAQSIKEVFFGRHGYRDGEWVDASRLRVDINGNPILYLARNFHGVYHYAGAQFPRSGLRFFTRCSGSCRRFYGAVKEYFDGRGPTWYALVVG